MNLAGLFGSLSSLTDSVGSAFGGDVAKVSNIIGAGGKVASASLTPGQQQSFVSDFATNLGKEVVKEQIEKNKTPIYIAAGVVGALILFLILKK